MHIEWLTVIIFILFLILVQLEPLVKLTLQLSLPSQCCFELLLFAPEGKVFNEVSCGWTVLVNLAESEQVVFNFAPMLDNQVLMLIDSDLHIFLEAQFVEIFVLLINLVIELFELLQPLDLPELWLYLLQLFQGKLLLLQLVHDVLGFVISEKVFQVSLAEISFAFYGFVFLESLLQL
jgi:hypothetical protein